MTHVHMIEDTAGDLVDIRYACSGLCAADLEFPYPSVWPGGMETDHAVHCENCGDLMWNGINEREEN